MKKFKIGNLVKRKPKWGDWVEHNPWMTSKEDGEIGIVVGIRKGRAIRTYEILWPAGNLSWHLIEEIEATNECR